jgi:hypothetical protein
MRRILVLLLLAGSVAAGGPGRLTPEERQALITAVGGNRVWGELPGWRQRMITHRWLRYRTAAPEQRAEIERHGLRAYLIKPADEFGLQRLPPDLREDLERVPRGVRDLAGKLVLVRLRQLRLDRHLALVPFEARRGLFRRLFPEPFDPSQAHRARGQLDRKVVASLVRRAGERIRDVERTQGRELSEEERRDVVRALAAELEQQVVDRVRKELLRFRSRHPGKVRQMLEREGFFLLDRIRLFATPRQRELIRYALSPEDCPLVDPEFLGPRPEDRAERKRWERDFRILARVDLLSEAGFPPEMVLHLASSSSPEDFHRAVKRLRGHRSGPGDPQSRAAAGR